MNYLTITSLNDYVFCPASIYFHNLYHDKDTSTYYSFYQIDGKAAHFTIDENKYSSRKDVICGLDVFSEKYHLAGKIDIYYSGSRKLVERKKKIKTVFDGYVYQLYGQYFGLEEMGYPVESLILHSLDDNKNYNIPLPKEDSVMLEKFEGIIYEINNFDLKSFRATNNTKCEKCIYYNACTFTNYDE